MVRPVARGDPTVHGNRNQPIVGGADDEDRAADRLQRSEPSERKLTRHQAGLRDEPPRDGATGGGCNVIERERAGIRVTDTKRARQRDVRDVARPRR